MDQPQPSPEELKAWIQRHKVCWEISPLQEMIKGHGVQRTGYELHLFAELTSPGAGMERATAAEDVYAGLRRVVNCLKSDDNDPLAHSEVSTFDHSAHLRSETGFVPEVQITFVATQAHAGRQLTDQEIHARIVAVEAELHGLGLHRKAWGQAPSR